MSIVISIELFFYLSDTASILLCTSLWSDEWGEARWGCS